MTNQNQFANYPPVPKPTPTPASKQIPVKLDRSNIPLLSFFSHYSVQKDDEFATVTLGYISFKFIKVICTIVMPMVDVGNNRAAMLKYLSDVGTITKAQKNILPSELEPNVVLTANLVEMCRTGESAETIFHNYSFKEAFDISTKKITDTSVKAYPVGLFRSTLDTQKQLILDLYGE